MQTVKPACASGFPREHNLPEIHRNQPNSKGICLAGLNDTMPNVRGKRCKTENAPANAKENSKPTRMAFGDITNAVLIAQTTNDKQELLLDVTVAPHLSEKFAALCPTGKQSRPQNRHCQNKTRAIAKSVVTTIPEHVLPEPAASPERKRKWDDIDAMNEEDPQACSHFAPLIFEHLKEAERTRRPSANYLKGVQKELNHSMRAILVDWLIEVGEEFRLCADTLFLAVNYIDRFLSVHKVTRSQLQLVGVTCIWIAAKYEEIYPPNVKEFVYITDNTYNKEELLNMEELILSTLSWELTVPTSKTFLRRLLQVCYPDEKLHYLSNYLAELSMLDTSLMSYLPSELAASAVYLANTLLKREPWSDNLAHYSGYEPKEIIQCVETLSKVHGSVCSDVQLPALRDKYGSMNYHCVSSIPPLATPCFYVC